MNDKRYVLRILIKSFFLIFKVDEWFLMSIRNRYTSFNRISLLEVPFKRGLKRPSSINPAYEVLDKKIFILFYLLIQRIKV